MHNDLVSQSFLILWFYPRRTIKIYTFLCLLSTKRCDRQAIAVQPFSLHDLYFNELFVWDRRRSKVLVTEEEHVRGWNVLLHAQFVCECTHEKQGNILLAPLPRCQARKQVRLCCLASSLRSSCRLQTVSALRAVWRCGPRTPTVESWSTGATF